MSQAYHQILTLFVLLPFKLLTLLTNKLSGNIYTPAPFLWCIPFVPNTSSHIHLSWVKAERSQQISRGHVVHSLVGSMGRPVKVLFKLDYQCPCAGALVPFPNSCKKDFVSWQCGCEARFSILLHIPTNLLHVAWFWCHNHDSHLLKATNGMGWRQLQKLLYSDDLLQVHDFILFGL
ncbi:hypothetical protein VP01_2524g1 [Puccinia sorghi]|uniref:Uncharacterized protein n=1 Tax=Puccinia sorghi TaxID=27349 RepID=A0A0L6V5H1_9BASI|nr:hypothetical protein VP01_2524g1 [Puccinia sorghi]